MRTLEFLLPPICLNMKEMPRNLDKENKYRVAAVSVTYGSRLSLFSKTAEAILRDPHVVKLIVVDNASMDSAGLEHEAAKYGDRMHVIRHDTNLGSAGGFAAGIEAARKEDVDYIYLSDDDLTISDGFVETFRIAHQIIGNDKTVLCARRKSFWAGTDVHYAPDIRIRPRRYFNILNPHIFTVFLKAILRINEGHVRHDPSLFVPIIPSRGWAYAGVFIPVEATRKAPLPDVTLGLYLDDIVYSWGVIDAGYKSFALIEPHLEDLEMTHAGAHTSTGLFATSVSATKIYYETRNRVRVSLAYGHASRALLALQVAIWLVGVSMIGMLRQGISHRTIARLKLIAEALRAGFDTSRPVPSGVAVRI